MLDIKFIRENPDAVRENIKKKFQDAKLPLVDEVLDLDSKRRAAIAEADQLRSNRNTLSKQIGMLMGQAKKDPAKLAEAEAVKQQVKEQADRLAELEKQETELEEKLHHNMLLIPQMIDSSVPIGKDDSENVEVQRFGACEVPDFPIPYHVDIMESFNGIDLDAAGRVSGSGFYYLLGDIARLHEAVLAYGRDFMIDKGLHLPSVHPLHDPRQRGGGRYEPDRHGRHDVQDRRGGPVPDRHQRALHDRPVH